MKSKTLCSLFFSLITTFSLFADISVISPVSGVWANKQSLLLSLEKGQEAYYSLNGTDPLVSGFAYDGPVIIDVTGNVEIRVLVIDSNGKKNEKTVSYTVNERNLENNDASVFLRSFTSVPVYEYTPGTEISIPEEFYFSTGNGDLVYLPAKKIALASDSCSIRYIPLILTDGSSFWRTVILTNPIYGIVNQRSVPFSIEDWNKVVFTNKNFIYSVDNNWWQGADKPIYLDRSVSHSIKWQDSSYKPGNPVYSFELPPKPTLTKTVRKDGAVIFSTDAPEKYKLGASESSKTKLAAGLFSAMCFDAFWGDDVTETETVSAYVDNVYQGNLSFSYNIDRRPPSTPVLIPSQKESFIRKTLKINVSSDKDTTLFYAVALPLELDEDFNSSSDDLTPLGSYKVLSSPTLSISSNSEKAVLCRVSVFAQDSAGNKSSPVEYSVVIDPCNYYFDASADSSKANGSKEFPLTSLKADFFNNLETKFVHLHIQGTIEMPNQQVFVPVNCRITGENNALLSFKEKSSLLMRVSSLEINNCIINKTENYLSQNDPTRSLFELENAILSMNGTEIVSQFLESGSIIQGISSAIMVNNCGIINQAPSYSAIVSGVDTRVQVSNSRISAIAQTAVNFSLHDGSLKLNSSACKVVGSIGRIAELFGSEYSAKQNSFTGELSTKQRVEPVWKDSSVVVLEESKNQIVGF